MQVCDVMALEHRQKRIRLIIYLGLIAATLVAYEPVRHNDFVNLDDYVYVTKNPNVSGGITRDSVIWAFTKSYALNWHPLTWLSHMLDCEIYGLNPLGHHITNVLIHTANTLLLFLLLSRMTGAIWRSAFVAAAFALHPIHVESVAWVAERKDMLSGLFWMLTMLAYVRYAERPNIQRYLLVPAAFVMGLVSKPMVVTLPFVLLLLDWWPLDRLARRENDITTANLEQQTTAVGFPRATLLHLVIEKVPLIVLSAVFSVITFVVQKRGGAMASSQIRPLSVRIISAAGCYLNYIVKMAYPKNLAVLYPLSGISSIDAAALTIMGAAVLLVLFRHGRRWLVVGLLWYLGTLLPVSGIVQVGSQIMADRYTYLPSIGVFIIAAWGATELFAKLPHLKPALAAAGAAALVAMVVVTRIQVSYWRDSPTLFDRTLAITKNNCVIHNAYGSYLCRQGRYDEAIEHFKEGTRMCPEYLPVRQNIYLAFLEQGKFDEVIAWLTLALKERKDWPNIHEMYNDLGMAYEQKGDLALAEMNYREALTLKPDYVPAQNGLVSVLTKQGKIRRPPKAKVDSQQN
jgi:Tfp pilus assembly protein PilF